MICCLAFPTPTQARTTATYGQNAVGDACNNVEKATDYDAIAQCNSGTGAGTFQTAPIIVGTVTAPPYAATTCDANKAGMIQWTGSAFQGCDGTNWTNFGAGVCAGPSSVSFTNQTDVTVSSEITSNAPTMSGFTCAAQVVCSGCVIVKNGTPVGTSTTTVAGDTIAVRQTSSANYNTMTTVTAYIGTTSASFSVTTGPDDCDGSPTIGQVCSDGTIYAGLSPDGNVKMFTTPCDAGMTGTQGSCTGTRLATKWSYGVTIETDITSANTGETNTDSLYALNTNADGPYEAATYCHDLDSNGHTDWYLPALGELAILYQNNGVIGGFLTDGTYYWSSTEDGTSSAYGQRFSDGSQSYGGKNFDCPVRCSRR